MVPVVGRRYPDEIFSFIRGCGLLGAAVRQETEEISAFLGAKGFGSCWTIVGPKVVRFLNVFNGSVFEKMISSISLSYNLGEKLKLYSMFWNLFNNCHTIGRSIGAPLPRVAARGNSRRRSSSCANAQISKVSFRSSSTVWDMT